MCYSAQIEAEYKLYVRMWGADISLLEFYKLYWARTQGQRVNIPRAVDTWFDQIDSEEARQIRSLIAEHRTARTADIEQQLFAQRRRLADAERKLQGKPTKAAAESARIATGKVEQLRGWLDALHRTELTADDARFYPGWYAPVMVMEHGRRVIKPMRYQCRPAGAPATHDRKFPGTYNARRDSLGGYWRTLFGYRHGVMIVSAFFENVDRDGSNVVLEFRPRPEQPMLIACLWSHWKAPGEPDLLSFAAITDEPPSEIAAAGHDRCIIPIKLENVDAWLQPDPRDLGAQQAILDDRPRPYFEHRLAA